MQNVRLQIYGILQRGSGLASAFDPTVTQLEGISAAVTDPGGRELRALIDDDRRTIRAAKLEIESVMGSVDSTSTYHSALDFADKQRQERTQSQEYLPEEHVKQKQEMGESPPTDVRIVDPKVFKIVPETPPLGISSFPEEASSDQSRSREHHVWYGNPDRDLVLSLGTKSGSHSRANLANLEPLDHGGIRGLSQLLILQELMLLVTERVMENGYDRNTSIHPTELFDWIVGAGSGG